MTDKNPYIDDPDFPPKRRPNAYTRLPYGYQPTEEDPCVLEPNPEMAPFIKEALDYIDSGGALRETSAWLTEKTGVKISHQGINKIWKERRGSDPQNEREKKQKKQRQKQKPKTGPEKKKAQIKRKAADAKRILSMQEKKLQNWVEPEEYKKGKRAPDPYPTNSISDTLDHEAEPAEQRVVFKPNPGPQTEFLAAPEQEVLYGGAAGGGKAVCLYTVVPSLEKGYTTMSELEVGDHVFGSDGLPTRITWKSEVFTPEKMMRVWFNTGEHFDVDSGHLWLTLTDKERDHNKKHYCPNTIEPRPRTTQEISDTVLVSGRKNHSVEVAKSLQISARDFSVDPYPFGLQLGAGSKYALSEGRAKAQQRIPEEYLFAHHTQRLELLRGLMDTNGTIDRTDDACEVSLSDETLAKDVLRLLSSLGIKTSWRVKRFCGEGLKHDYRLKFYSEEIVFNRPSMEIGQKTRPNRDYTRRRYISAVEEIEPRPVQCISVDNRDRSYLIGNSHIVTHNSYALLADPMRYFDHPSFAGIIFRRTNDELRELIWKSQELYPQAFPGAKWQERKSQWVFPNGGRLWLTYLERDEDVLRYQGQSFSYIAFDEITQYPTPFPWDYMRSRLRTTAPDLPVYQRACVDEGDVLTETGWKPIQNVSVGERVYSLLEDGQLVLRKVTGFHEYDVEEELVRVRKKNLYMSMTQDHRVLYRKQNSDKFELIRFNEHKSKSIDIARASLSYESAGYNPPVAGFSSLGYARFLGLYVAEGCTPPSRKGNYKVLITQNKKENHELVRSIMEESGCRVCYCSNGDFQITNKALHEHLKPLGKAHEKHFPREFLSQASKEQLQNALDSYLLGDGHWQSDASCIAVTCSRQLASDLQEIAVKLGYKTQVSRQVLNNPRHNDRFCIYLTINGPTTKVDKNPSSRNDVVLEPYYGKVYCLSVEGTENFVLRQQDFVWVSGNTTNPGGSGHSWCKKMFIDPAPAGQPFTATNIETGEPMVYPDNHEKAGQPLFQRRFIPASLYDNPYLTQDTSYEASLLSLPEMQRRQLLEGDWTIAEGAAFSEFRTATHVCEPFEIPENWRRFRSCDYGYSSYSAVHWFAIDPAYETLFVYRELYVSKHTGKDLAKAVLEAEKGERIDYGVLDSSAWHQRGQVGPSIAEEMISMGCRWRPSDRSNGARVSGKNRLHELLKVDETTGMPGIVFFNTCRQIIADLPVIPADPKGSDDIDPKYQSDHAYDSIRYGVMSRPRAFSPFSDGAGVPTKRWRPAVPQFGY